MTKFTASASESGIDREREREGEEEDEAERVSRLHKLLYIYFIHIQNALGT